MSNKPILLGIIAALILVVSGVSYAYFTVTIKGSISDVSIRAGSMVLTIADDGVITNGNLNPGDSVTKTFTITNTGDLNTKYSIYINDLINELITPTDLVYKLERIDDTVDDIEGVIPTTSGAIATNITINKNESQDYRITITYQDLSRNQNDNANKLFSGKIRINEVAEVNYYLDNVLVTTMPSKDNSTYQSNTCTNDAVLTFDEIDWNYTTTNVTGATSCNIYFESITP